MEKEDRITIDYIKENGAVGLLFCIVRKAVRLLLLTGITFLFGVSWKKRYTKLYEKGKEKLLQKARYRVSVKEKTNAILEDKEKLLYQWTSCWEQMPVIHTLCHCTEESYSQNLDVSTDWEDVFLQLFIDNYIYVLSKKKKNKRKNFFWKGMFVAVVALGFIGLLALLCFQIKNGKNTLPVLAENSLCLLVLVLLCGAIAKWMDIKKYQETWTRHSDHLHLLNNEMLLFIYGKKPYHKDDRKQVFMDRIMGIWESNQQKFSENMKKESTLMDIFKHLKMKEE